MEMNTIFMFYSLIGFILMCIAVYHKHENRQGYPPLTHLDCFLIFITWFLFWPIPIIFYGTKLVCYLILLIIFSIVELWISVKYRHLNDYNLCWHDWDRVFHNDYYDPYHTINCSKCGLTVCQDKVESYCTNGKNNKSVYAPNLYDWLEEKIKSKMGKVK